MVWCGVAEGRGLWGRCAGRNAGQRKPGKVHSGTQTVVVCGLGRTRHTRELRKEMGNAPYAA